jgi:hypothetical protein
MSLHECMHAMTGMLLKVNHNGDDGVEGRLPTREWCLPYNQVFSPLPWHTPGNLMDWLINSYALIPVPVSVGQVVTIPSVTTLTRASNTTYPWQLGQCNNNTCSTTSQFVYYSTLEELGGPQFLWSSHPSYQVCFPYTWERFLAFKDYVSPGNISMLDARIRSYESSSYGSTTCTFGSSCYPVAQYHTAIRFRTGVVVISNEAQ